jgi:hypothetical protein
MRSNLPTVLEPLRDGSGIGFSEGGWLMRAGAARKKRRAAGQLGLPSSELMNAAFSNEGSQSTTPFGNRGAPTRRWHGAKWFEVPDWKPSGKRDDC